MSGPASADGNRVPIAARWGHAEILVVGLVAAFLNWATPAAAIVSSNTGTTGLNGLYINNFLGANQFYSNGYTGTRAIVANIEAGAIWNQHETLTKVTTFLKDPDPALVGTQLGQFDAHATRVGQTIAGAGPNNYQKGIAYGATLWSGAIATQWTGTPPTTTFNSTLGSFLYPYLTAMQTGVNGQKANVVNSSYSFSTGTGNDPKTLALDALIRANHILLTDGASDTGPNPGTVRSPGLGFNTLVVGALGSDTSSPPYNTVSTFSGRGPSDVATPAGLISVGDTTPYGVFNGRATVDIAAPGQNLTLAFYGGTTGGNTGGTDPTGGATNRYNLNANGDSFAAPMVAGGAALLVDAGIANFGGGNAIDGRVLKAVLMNSADKTPGWNNGQSLVTGVVTTTQGLDYNVGAGRMDLAQAYNQYLTGTTGGSGRNVAATGWKFDTVQTGGHDDYQITSTLVAGSTFTGTLVWYADRSITSIASDYSFTASDNALSHLELQLWENTSGGPREVAVSDALFTTTQHFSFALPDTGSYFLRVVDDGVYSEWSGSAPSEDFGLAWSDPGTVPEPPSLSMAAMAAVAVAFLMSRSRLRAVITVPVRIASGTRAR